MFSEIDSVFIILCGIIILLVIIVAVASYRHVHKTGFKPKFIHLSDGSVKMEFYNFGWIQRDRTKRFYEQYKAGMTVPYNGTSYRITELKEISDSSILRPDVKIVAYLEEEPK